MVSTGGSNPLGLGSIPKWGRQIFRQELIILAYVYKITNDINDKVYIGLTYYSIQSRWQTHLKDRKKFECKDRPLYRAMNKYGIDHFLIQEIEECSDEVVNEREKYWIQFYNSYYDGYNATFGGEGRREYDALIFVEDYQNGLNETEIAIKYKCDMTTVRRALNLYNIYPDMEQRKRAKELYGKKCCGIKDGRSIEFLTMMDAARFIKDNNLSCDTIAGIQTHIGHVCNGKRKTAYGYKWQYIN